jgi:single-strand DNA-binding protein
MQQVTGRLTGDAVVKTTNGGKEVVNFSIADNGVFKRKGENEPTQITTFFNCSYWVSTSVAKVLRKGAVVQLSGRISARAYQTNTGDTGTSLDFHTNRIDVLAYAKANSEDATKNSKDNKKAEPADKDDLPF